MTRENGFERTPTGWAAVLGAWGFCLALFLVVALGATVTRSASWETAAETESPAPQAVPELSGRLQLAVGPRVARF